MRSFSALHVNLAFLSFWFLEVAREVCYIFDLLAIHVEKLSRSSNKHNLQVHHFAIFHKRILLTYVRTDNFLTHLIHIISTYGLKVVKTRRVGGCSTTNIFLLFLCHN